MCTVNNVMGDAYGAGLINHLSNDLCVLLDDKVKQNRIANGVHAEDYGISTTTTF